MKKVEESILRLLCAAALSSPSKSDLQQRDIIVLQNSAVISDVKKLLSAQSWIVEAPALLVFCGSNRRYQQMHERWGREFNDAPLDAVFNASVDAAIALTTFSIAAESIGLGCCPISAIRDVSQEVSELLCLPDYVFPVAALAVGYPSHSVRHISQRLPLSSTVHIDKYDDNNFMQVLEEYDLLRYVRYSPPVAQNNSSIPNSDSNMWSNKKTRRNTAVERTPFVEILKRKGYDF